MDLAIIKRNSIRYGHTITQGPLVFLPEEKHKFIIRKELQQI